MWAIKKFQGSSELTLRAKVTLPNVVSAANRKEVRLLVRSNHVPQGRHYLFRQQSHAWREASVLLENWTTEVDGGGHKMVFSSNASPGGGRSSWMKKNPCASTKYVLSS